MKENMIIKSLRQISNGTFKGASVLVAVLAVLVATSVILGLPLILILSLNLLGFEVETGISTYFGALLMMTFIKISTYRKGEKDEA